MDERGNFIVLYGPNNIGKTTQAELLASELKARKIRVGRLKYPVYDLEPTGPLINQAFRGHRQVTSRQLQQETAQNRHDFQPQLLNRIHSGEWLVSEDYKGTGEAWGVVDGIPLQDLQTMNEGLINPDLAILLDGKRFETAKEEGHPNEDCDSARWQKAREVHQQLAQYYGWQIVNANQPIEEVHADIVDIVEERFF
jgi:thymidylate kinase